ncbi:MAG TPA: hypothetical protein VJ180_14670 [Pyrinomonadaceae bacterium]|nr:hypothetical protein [Pyrinomonadaceae bacterium]
MKNSDKILFAIVAGVIVLVVVAFVVAFTRPEPTYQSEDSPEGITHNYLLALQQKDYERAYRYLSPDLRHYPPDIDKFMADVQSQDYNFRFDQNSVTLEIVSSEVNGNTATVDVRETRFYQGDLFNSGESSYIFKIRLRRDSSADTWKIFESEAYWVYCWSDTSTDTFCN